MEKMQKYNKAIQGAAGGGIGAAVAQLVVIMGWVPPAGEMALTIILATVLAAAGPAFGRENRA